MGERSSELDQKEKNINEIVANPFDDETNNRAGGVASELGASTTYSTTAMTANDGQTRDLSPVDSDREYSTATTGDATEVADATAEPAEIKAQIEQTRNEMSETINAIQEKLSFSNLAGQAREAVTDQISDAVESATTAVFGNTAERVGNFMAKVNHNINQFSEDYGPAISEAGQTVVKSARNNPVPFALIGLGIGWLIWQSRSSSKSASKSYRYYDDFDDTELSSHRVGESRESYLNRVRSKVGDASSAVYENVSGVTSKAVGGVSDVATTAYQGVGDVATTAYEKVGDVATTAYEKVGGAASTAYEKVGSVGSKAKQAASWTQETYSTQLTENPLAVGAVALALGAVVGLSLPSTEVEGQYMGEYRENLLQKAQDAAGGLIQQAQQMATDTVQNVTESVGKQ